MCTLEVAETPRWLRTWVSVLGDFNSRTGVHLLTSVSWISVSLISVFANVSSFAGFCACVAGEARQVSRTSELSDGPCRRIVVTTDCAFCQLFFFFFFASLFLFLPHPPTPNPSPRLLLVLPSPWSFLGSLSCVQQDKTGRLEGSDFETDLCACVKNVQVFIWSWEPPKRTWKVLNDIYSWLWTVNGVGVEWGGVGEGGGGLVGAAKGGLYWRCVYKRTKCTPAFFLFLFLWSEIAFTTVSVRLTFRLMEKSASGTDTRQGRACQAPSNFHDCNHEVSRCPVCTVVRIAEVVVNCAVAFAQAMVQRGIEEVKNSNYTHAHTRPPPPPPPPTHTHTNNHMYMSNTHNVKIHT